LSKSSKRLISTGCSTSKIYEFEFKYGSSTEKFSTRIKDLAELQDFVLKKLKRKYKIRPDLRRVWISHDGVELKLGDEEDLVLFSGSDSWEISYEVRVLVYPFGGGIGSMTGKTIYGAESISSTDNFQELVEQMLESANADADSTLVRNESSMNMALMVIFD
jgi:hypothetical protein